MMLSTCGSITNSGLHAGGRGRTNSHSLQIKWEVIVPRGLAALDAHLLHMSVSVNSVTCSLHTLHTDHFVFVSKIRCYFFFLFFLEYFFIFSCMLQNLIWALVRMASWLLSYFFILILQLQLNCFQMNNSVLWMLTLNKLQKNIW